jgi:hypothetical protein
MRHRFHALCPYFAMFPESFAEQWLSRLTKPGDIVLDPFCGRGTLPFQALLMERSAIGCDTNPVAYVISRAKTNAPAKESVLARLRALEADYDPADAQTYADELPVFFRHAYQRDTLKQLIYLRHRILGHGGTTDCMIAALALGALHGESNHSSRFLSNQMPHTISTKPDYSVRFWKHHKMRAPKRDVFAVLREQVMYRYASDRPEKRALILHIDMRDLPRRLPTSRKGIRCVVTSPPYFDVTNYAEDQWLRLWFLGGPDAPVRQTFSRDDRHGDVDKYWMMLADMWRSLGRVLSKNSNIVIRLGAARIGPDRLVSGLEGVAKAANRRVRLIKCEASEIVKRQTDAFRPGSTGCKVEVDCHFRMA